MDRARSWKPLLYALLVAGGMVIGYKLHKDLYPQQELISKHRTENKIDTLLQLIQERYVDSISTDKLLDIAIRKLLEELDPHSAYMDKESLEEAKIALEGDFEGIGIQFYIVQDTIMVIQVIPGGPSEFAGLQPGDKIIKIDTLDVAGKGITASKVVKLLRGKRGSKVKVTVLRSGLDTPLTFTIVRDVVKVSSIEAAFMLDDSTGYIRLTNFAQNTPSELREALQELLMRGMKQLILDLRGNPGGYLQIAVEVADEFLAGKKLVVYTEGRNHKRQEYYTSRPGLFEKGKLVVLVDEGTASAAEILASALQEWGRAKLVGRPTFGKGLVQEQYMMPDRSAVRLTVARYYTPSGRSLQKPYKSPLVESKDSATKTFFITPAGDTLYHEGGVQPDIYVEPDTSLLMNPLLIKLSSSGALIQFAYHYASNHGKELKTKFGDPEVFAEEWQPDEKFIQYFLSWLKQNKIDVSQEELNKYGKPVFSLIKAHIARQLWGTDGFYIVRSKDDLAIKKALEVLASHSS